LVCDDGKIWPVNASTRQSWLFVQEGDFRATLTVRGGARKSRFLAADAMVGQLFSPENNRRGRFVADATF
jgi:hypothetical protein